MFNVNEHIKRYLLNEYGGSEQKETVILDDNCKYMIKKPDPTREMNKKYILSYINNAYSEYIGCHIAKILGLNVQDTFLGEYQTVNRNGDKINKIVCLCKDIRNKDEKLRQFDTISLSSEDKNDVSFETIEYVVKQIKDVLHLSEEANEIRDFYYKLFVFDAFIGNTDRHNGNVAILLTNDDEYSRIAPIYDCGSCLFPLIDDSEIEKCNINSIALSVNSAIRDDKGELIRYNDFLLNNRIDAIDKALLELICKIDLKRINKMIDDTDYIPTIRKEFYKKIISIRYYKMFIPAMEKIFPIVPVRNFENIDLLSVYESKLKQIAALPEFDKYSINIADKCFCDVMRISKRYALLMDETKCVGLLPIRSNNDEVRSAISFFDSLGIDILNENIFVNVQNINIESEPEEEPDDDIDR